jgi:hypothetical protein
MMTSVVAKTMNGANLNKDVCQESFLPSSILLLISMKLIPRHSSRVHVM